MRMALAGLLLLASCVRFQPRQDDDPPIATPASASTVEPVQPAEAPAPAPIWREIGRSVQGRPLRAATMGFGSRKVLWVGGIHGDEREGRIATAELPGAFYEAGGADKVTLTIVEDINPDGSAMNVRWNANAVDLNRNFPAENYRPDRRFGKAPLSQPESLALHDLILALEPHLIIVAHSWRGDHFINYDGPAAGEAHRFSQLSGYRVQPSDGINPTPGSLGSWVGNKLGRAILTLEYERGRTPREAWAETREAILAVILDA